MTPFQIAVRNNNLRISRYYLGCGRLEVHCVMGASMPFDWRDQTLLRLALKYATPEVAQLILSFRHRLSTRRNTPTFSRVLSRTGAWKRPEYYMIRDYLSRGVSRLGQEKG